MELDAQFIQIRRNSRPILYLPHSLNRGGLEISTLNSDYQLNLCDMLVTFLSHTWQFPKIFYPNGSIGPSAFLYLLSASVWETNFRFLDKRIKCISFEKIRQPSVETNSELHDCREDLFELRDVVFKTMVHIPDQVKSWHREVFKELRRGEYYLPENTLNRILKDADQLSQFLMDSFQLLMSTISVLDAQTSLDQAARGTRLTQLAFIYVPLSFVTGIWGMNLKEINGSPLSVWVAVVSLIFIGLGTAGLFWGLKLWEERRHGKTKVPAICHLDNDT
jgi:CorA-like Mg2+ transporter protein